MRQIGTIEGEGAAGRFSDLLTAEGIDHQLDPEGGGRFAVWVHDEDRIPAATELLDRWRDDPSVAESPEIAEQARKLRKQKEKEEAAARKIRARSRPKLDRGLGIGNVTLLFILASVVVAVLSKLGKDDGVLHWLTISDYTWDSRFRYPHPAWQDVLNGQYWRLVTPIFIHYGILHIVFNLWWFKDLGTGIEKHHGLKVFLPLLLLTSVPPNAAQYVFTGIPFFGGMSGVVYGLLGYIWIRGKFDPLSGLHLPQDIVTFMIIWFFLGVFDVIPGLHMANWAHGVGLGMGMAYGFLLARLSPSFRLR